MRSSKRVSGAVAGFLTLATSVGMVLAGGVAAHADTSGPPWEPDPSAVGQITFYDSSGNVITGGSTSAAPFFAYAVGNTTVRSGDVQGAVYAANPNPSASPSNWFADQVTSFTHYPLTTGPANIQTLSHTNPVVTGASTDLSLDSFYGEITHYTGTGYTNVVQLRLRTANTGGNTTSTYDEAAVLLNPTAHTFQVIYPAPTQTVLTASPSPSDTATAVTLTATETYVNTTGSAGGTVRFYDGATALGTPQTVSSSGVAMLTNTFTTTGTHNLTAVFTPTNASLNTGSTGAFTEQITGVVPATGTSLAVTQDGVAGDSATLTATVGTPTSSGTAVNAGTVSFYDNGSTTPLNATPVTGTGGTYTLTLSTGFASGSHSVVAKFTPTDPTQFKSSQSAPQTFLTQSGACSQYGSQCQDVQSIEATVPVGTLVISSPYSAGNPLNLGTLALNSAATQFTGSAAFNNIVVTDTRAGNLPYTVSALASALSDGGSNPGSTINAENVGLTGLTNAPGTGFTGTVTTTNNPAASPAVAPTDTGSAGLGGTTPHTVFAVNHGEGTVYVSGLLTLNAPTSTEAGLFTGTITFTVG